MKNVNVVTLDNGIRIITEKIENVSTFSMGFFVKTGSICEEGNESGISHFIEHLMFKGTTNRSAKEISEYVDYHGGSINAFTSKEMTCYYIKMLDYKIDIAIDVLTDMFLNSTFTEENIDKERKVIIEEIKMYEDMPDEVAHEKSIEFAIEGVQSNSISGTPETLQKIGRNEIIKYLEKHYVAENLIIVVTGNIDEKYICKEIEKKMKNFRTGNLDRFVDMSYKIKSGEQLIKRDTNQAHLCLVTRGISSKSAHRYAASLISNVLSGGMSSRLFQKIREERGLVYSVYSYNLKFSNCGLMVVYAGTTAEKYKEVLELIYNELKDIKENGITDIELEKAKNKLKSEVIFGTESISNRMIRLGTSYLDERQIYNLEETIKKIDSVNMDEIKKAATFMFDEKYYSHTVVGNIEN